MATRKAFVSGHNYIQDIHMEPGIYTVLMKVKSMYGDVCSFALFDGTTWTHYDMDTVQGQWKWAYVTFRILVPMTKINLISRNYSAELPVYVVEPQIVAGNVPFDAGVNPMDLNTESKELQAMIKSMEYLKLAIGQDAVLEGALFTLVTILLKENMGSVVTAGFSGIQRSNQNDPNSPKDAPAIWAGGTYADAIAGIAKAIIHHDGRVKFEEAEITGVINALSGRIGHLTIEELGRIVMKDPATAKERLIFANQDIPTVAYLEDQTQAGGNTSIEFLSVTTGVPSVYSSVLNVTQNGSTLTFGGATMNIQATAPIGYGGTVQLELTLERNGVPYVSLGTVGIFVSGGQTEEESLIVAPKTWGGVSSGSYRVKLEFTSIGTYTSISGTSSTSTLSWNFSKNVEWFQFGLNGMMSWWQNLHAYFSNTEISFRAPSDKFNAPGVLAAGSVDAAGVQANVWGAKSNPAGAGAISGGRGVPLSNMKHDNYVVQITPHTATTFRVGTKTTISFQALGTGGFDYVVIGNNY